METFAEYLSFYVKRAGISDSELARAIDVSRQTVFRWKEGLTGRPNNRDDVLAIAKKLRLSPEETNTLLQAAGFRPQGQPSAEQEPDQQPIQKEVDEVASVDSPEENLLQTDPAYLWRYLLKMPVKKKWLAIAIICEVALFTLIGVIMNIDYSPSSRDAPKETSPVFTGETLVVISPFTGSDINRFSHQLSDAIEREISGNRIDGYRVAELSDAIAGKEEAEQILQNAGTELVVYGQFQDGLISIRFEPKFEELDTDKIEFESDSDLPLETQVIALLALAHLSMQKGDTDQAMALLSQAQNILYDNVDNEQLYSIVDSLLGQLRDDVTSRP